MYTVGLVPSPGVAHEHVTKIIPKIKQLLTEMFKIALNRYHLAFLVLRAKKPTTKPMIQPKNKAIIK